ncbi:MAG: hypothetical protein KJS68_02240 [Alphaproteobacteria bacterium]|nr:hypothetical protein [Alphaproteobacteria bacterium]
MGQESDFLVDGGKHLLPPSRSCVLKNLAGITSTLSRFSADVHLFQEMARPGLLTYGVNVQARIEREFSNAGHSFRNDTVSRLIPVPFGIHNGTEIFSRYAVATVQIDPLPDEPGLFFGLLKKSYAVHSVRLQSGNGQVWAILNIHLAAFDAAAVARKKQLQQVLSLAMKEFKRGCHVIVGGDWNLKLTQTSFLHSTDPKHLFWLHEFPQDYLSQGWKLVFDPHVPTVRTNNQPYRPGVNYTAIIDGFLVSPNVEIDSVTTIDTGFQFTDHQPTVLRASMSSNRSQPIK